MSSYSRWGPPPPPYRGGGGAGSYNILGLFVPKPIAWLIAIVLTVSALGSLLERAGWPVVTLSFLNIDAIWQGQIWRLVTWTALELRPLGLVFGCIFLYFIGPDLISRWGARRFFILFFGGGAVVGAITAVIGRFIWRDVAMFPLHMGFWPMEEALIIAWAAAYPDRQILSFFVLPLSGRNLIVFTIAITVVFALLHGFHVFMPHFVAEFAALIYCDVFSFRRLYLRGRMAMLQRDYKRRAGNLRAVERDRDEPPRWMH